MLLLFKQQIQELFDYGKEQFFQKNVMYIPLAGGGGGTPGNSSWGSAAPVLQILTFIHSRSSLKNHTRFQTKMGKVHSRFQTKKAQKPYPLGRHIPI